MEFWSQFYSDGTKVLDADEKICYFEELNLTNDLTEENVRRLLRWKDPRRLTHRVLSGPKEGQDNSKVSKVLARVGLINQFRNGQITEEEMRLVAEQVFTDGIVWKAFLLHVAKPHIYPIADQNVFRVWSLHTKIKDERTWKSYDHYCSYFRQIAQALGVAATIENIRELKRIDDALMEFGRFLNAYCYGATRRRA
ncbi:MAG: hypothetical protein WBE37_32915 [Bryobacteraceae bacterium]